MTAIERVPGRAKDVHELKIDYRNVPSEVPDDHYSLCPETLTPTIAQLVKSEEPRDHGIEYEGEPLDTRRVREQTEKLQDVFHQSALPAS